MKRTADLHVGRACSNSGAITGGVPGRDIATRGSLHARVNEEGGTRVLGLEFAEAFGTRHAGVLLNFWAEASRWILFEMKDLSADPYAFGRLKNRELASEKELKIGAFRMPDGLRETTGVEIAAIDWGKLRSSNGLGVELLI
ncbi:hypothetical protein ACLOJK_001244 [Asimina triloba]